MLDPLKWWVKALAPVLVSAPASVSSDTLACMVLDLYVLIAACVCAEKVEKLIFMCTNINSGNNFFFATCMYWKWLCYNLFPLLCIHKKLHDAVVNYSRVWNFFDLHDRHDSVIARSIMMRFWWSHNCKWICTGNFIVSHLKIIANLIFYAVFRKNKY